MKKPEENTQEGNELFEYMRYAWVREYRVIIKKDNEIQEYIDDQSGSPKKIFKYLGSQGYNLFNSIIEIHSVPHGTYMREMRELHRETKEIQDKIKKLEKERKKLMK